MKCMILAKETKKEIPPEEKMLLKIQMLKTYLKNDWIKISTIIIEYSKSYIHTSIPFFTFFYSFLIKIIFKFNYELANAIAQI